MSFSCKRKDQLFGIWYIKLMDLEDDESRMIIPLEKAKKTLQTIFQKYVLGYGQGYFFKTPDAYRHPEEFVYNNPETKYGEKLFCAMKHMRPGAIWAVLEALLITKGGK